MNNKKGYEIEKFEKREERTKIRMALEELNEVETWDVHVQQAIHLLEEVLDNK